MFSLSFAMLIVLCPFYFVALISLGILVSPGVIHTFTLHLSRDESSVTEWIAPGLARMLAGLLYDNCTCDTKLA